MRSPATIPEPFPGPTGALVSRASENRYAGRVVRITAHGSKSGPAEAPPPASGGVVHATSPTWLLATRGRRVALICLAVLLVDQASKATRPAGTFIVNTGGAAILPSPLGDALWKSHTFGAACDAVACVLLLAAFGIAGALINTVQRVAAIAVLAGLLSNLVDRLGASSLFHAGLPRGSIDWIPIPAWPTAKANIADIVIALGVLAYAYHPARHAVQAIHALAHRSRTAHLAAATAGLITVAIWTIIWQANRHNAELKPTTPYETPAQCTAISHPSDGMDWVSYRPTAGPVPYRTPGSGKAILGCAGRAR